MALASEHSAIRIELAYAQNDNLLFQERIYRENASLWLHKSLAGIVIKAAKTLKEHGYRLILYDGLRTIEAQRKMLQTEIVRHNPHWLEEPRLLSPPGAGAHPRGMAIDCSLETPDGILVDMGTPFDFLSENAEPEHNPAHRDHPYHPDQIIKNRSILNDAMTSAASELKTELVLLPQEWWDFRLPSHIYEAYEPLHDRDLPPPVQMTNQDL